MTKRKVEIGETRVAGEGGDGNIYGVTSLTTKGEGKKAARKKPCKTCPWRQDAERGRFPAEAYRESAHTAYDGAMSTFACHESGAEAPATCAGFLLVNAENNIGVRLAMFAGDYDPSRVRNPDKVKLFKGYREMAIANGVDPEDPALKPCRGDGEPFPGVHGRDTIHSRAAEGLRALAEATSCNDEDQ